MKRSTQVVGGLVLAAAGVIGGCRAGGSQGQAVGRVYPREVPKGEVLDIQVIREGTSIVFTNTTARAMGPSTVWVNMRFSRAIDGLGVGESKELDLREFKDEFGEVFRAGGFFATEAPQPVVLVQIEAPKADGSPEMLGMIVVQAMTE